MSETQHLEIRGSTEQIKSYAIEAPSGGYTCSQLLMDGTLMGVIASDVDEGVNVGFLYWIPKIVMPCDPVGTGEFATGADVFGISGETKVYSTQVSTSYLIGKVTLAPEIGDEEVEFDFDGDCHNY